MRILYDSKLLKHKTPFGTLIPDQVCTLNIHVPVSVQSCSVTCLLLRDDGKTLDQEILLSKKTVEGPYEIWTVDFSIPKTGLYFYYFRIATPTGTFRLFKEGDDTNMEAGVLWQVSCVPADFRTPDWAKGATIYQVFPDRFHKSGECDLTGKLTPYTVHASWYEEVDWQPTPEGIVLNNDFYGGNFKGITEKMDYIASLGTTILYLNPISKSFSSHRYDTGDYKVPDPMLGTEADFVEMVEAAHKRGIKVILDGVYSHTGSNSPYFNREGQFDSVGAHNSQESPYYSWYTFYNWPHSYHSWWNFDTLPTVNKMDPAFIKYIITDEDSVVAHWLKLGADGFRLDVADELPDEFIKLLRDRVKEIKPDAYVLGEVWEDASNKTAYNKRRTYFTNGELDSVMNYPFRTAIINFVRGFDNGKGLKETVMSIVENYPQEVVHCNMNLLGTHDTARILTALVDDFDGSREEKARRRLSRNSMDVAVDRLMMASFLQYTLPGSPSLYYGDEACMEGYRDPFNRRPYPWGREDLEILSHFQRLGQLRKNFDAFRLGDIQFFEAGDKHIGFTRSYQGRTFRIYCNRSGDPWEIPTNRLYFGMNMKVIAKDHLIIGPRGFCVTEEL
ncbi:MAG: glycoside hydrolase family 13 protein [Oscillospiraceae bacterium]|nr:glycoside hydrolase family 13 protein [Oscillospiraceae bacterium]